MDATSFIKSYVPPEIIPIMKDANAEGLLFGSMQSPRCKYGGALKSSPSQFNSIASDKPIPKLQQIDSSLALSEYFISSSSSKPFS